MCDRTSGAFGRSYLEGITEGMCNSIKYPKKRVSTPLNPRWFGGVEILVGSAKSEFSLVERSRWHSLSVKRKPKPKNLGCYFHAGP